MSEEFGAVLKKRLLNKFIEVYQGDTHQSLTGYSDHSHEDKSVIYGKLVDVDGSCLILEVTREGSVGYNVGYVYVNTWSVSSVTVPSSGISMDDVYWASTNVTHTTRDKTKA